ncbi:hypothetical protein CP082626L3_1071A, partial [Chlamydia psittaci 08-2626_L3]
MPGYPKL